MHTIGAEFIEFVGPIMVADDAWNTEGPRMAALDICEKVAALCVGDVEAVTHVCGRPLRPLQVKPFEESEGYKLSLLRKSLGGGWVLGERHEQGRKAIL